MRTLATILIQATVAMMVHTRPVAAEEIATGNVSVSVPVNSRTSLKVSNDVLQFNVIEAGGVATASVDVSAGARVLSGVDVVLTVEPLRQLEGASGAADVQTAVTFEGDGDGLVGGQLDRIRPTVAGRWQGSGLRHGRLSFAIRARTAATYTLPVRFVLSTP
jgi:hypothetical protein